LILAAPPIPKRPRLDESIESGGASTSVGSAPPAEWYETVSTGEDGSTVSYFWNIQTGETSWELPAGTAVVSLAEQEAPNTSTQPTPTANVPPAAVVQETGEIQSNKERDVGGKRKETTNVVKKSFSGKKPNGAGGSNRISLNVGARKGVEISKKREESDSSDDDQPDSSEAVRGKPYGEWQVVEKEETKRDEFAYLPQNRWIKDEAQNLAATVEEEEEEDPKTKITFEERTAPSVGNVSQTSASCTFKKRKAPVGGRNFRNRDD